ncbi:hypothetical protein E1293_02220 [Actinomadura darangshiensis]|uniref:Uncharacterized protein n=1 Tax=Actinomadura darangshiensis TaxID=705336 RepID=A0A4R5BWB2_9ACTN|nr:hypothetical protein [Actinomadura darangshiensis]TDD91421.1 hypothetical protein E1293_02220 [Actinomadura darangshiensis]
MDRPGGIDRGTLAGHIAGDVDRVAPLLARILLVRAVLNVRHHRSGHSLWVAKDMAADCRDELEEAGAATRNLARVLAPTHKVDRDLTPAITATDRLSSAVRSEGDAYARYSLATDPDIAIDRERADKRGDEWEAERGSVRDAQRALPADLGSGQSGSLLLDRALDRVFERGMYYQARHYLFSREPERAWRRRVAGVLHDAACVRLARGNEAAAGDLAALVRTGRRALDGTAPSTWARQAAIRLEEIGGPVFAGREPATADKATAIRLLALCLAGESENSAVGDPFRSVVIGITLLESDTD